MNGKPPPFPLKNPNLMWQRCESCQEWTAFNWRLLLYRISKKKPAVCANCKHPLKTPTQGTPDRAAYDDIRYHGHGGPER